MFLEEQLPRGIRYGSASGDRYAVDVTVDAADNTYVHMRHPYPIKRFEVGYTNKSYADLLVQVKSLFDRVGGIAGGFRMPDRTEFSTNGYINAPTFSDQQCVSLDPVAGTWQIMVWYGSPSNDAPRRRVRKPRAGTVLAGIKAISGTVFPIAAFSVSPITGVITLNVNKQRMITGITQAAQAAITVGSGHGIVAGDSVVISGVAGMAQINGLRASVISTSSTTVTMGINSTGFTAYGGGGQVNTRPQAGEAVTAGCLFDIPVRFETDLSGLTIADLNVMSVSINLIEWLNPDPQ